MIEKAERKEARVAARVKKQRSRDKMRLEKARKDHRR
jgi:hypothetical protein